MRRVKSLYDQPPELLLGKRLMRRVPEADQRRQRTEVDEILRRFETQPGVVLADEVGMGKTFVALAIAYTVAMRSPLGPVIVMVPPNLVDKWVQDLSTFCELYLDGRRPQSTIGASREQLRDPRLIRYGVARHSVELLKLLDDAPRERSQMVFLAQGAMSRRQSDKWIRLALIAEALRRHARGQATRLVRVRNQIHRFVAELIWAVGEQRAHGWGVELWQELLRTHPSAWRGIYNDSLRDAGQRLPDDPVPKSVIRALDRSDLRELADALRHMPIVARGGEVRVSERLNACRRVLREVEAGLWKRLLAQAKWRSPLLVMDEAHHLKNPGTALARQLQSHDLEGDLSVGDGAMAHAFDRMLFLTATPFQLGHHELVRVLERFGDVRWNKDQLGPRDEFLQRLTALRHSLDRSQRAAIGLQRCWSRLRPDDRDRADDWWERLLASPRDQVNSHQRAVIEAFEVAQSSRLAAQVALRPWIVRHNKGTRWAGTGITRRLRLDGAAIADQVAGVGLPITAGQLLPFFLAARSSVRASQDLLGEALASSYEAFRSTRQNRAMKDEQEDASDAVLELARSRWYLGEFDRALERCTGFAHPKMDVSVRKVVDLWQRGEKVLVFAFYRHTCRALRLHISREVEARVMRTGQERMRAAGQSGTRSELERQVARVQRRYFDDADAPGRRAVDAALGELLALRSPDLDEMGVEGGERSQLLDVMRRFLRVTTTVVRCFPLGELDSLPPDEAVRRTLDFADASDLSWRQKFDGFIAFLARQCSSEERRRYLEAASEIQTGAIRLEEAEEEGEDGASAAVLANVQMATGGTRRDARSRLMRAFNTPFFPDILVCSEVMGEGVDLQRFCRHVIHHDLAWNPSTIEQRTGRIDRLGCKAEGRQPIAVYLPYLAGTADERMYRVMSDREQWFRVVMGQDAVARLISPDAEAPIPLPERVAQDLSFDLSIRTDLADDAS